MACMRQPLAGTLLVIAVLTQAAGCAPADPKPGAAATSASASPTAQGPSVDLTRGPTPQILIGEWIYVPDPHVRLVLKERGFEILHPPEAPGGALASRGDELDFLTSTFCDLGVGRYRWSLTGGQLHLRSIVADPCDGRSDRLDGGVFRRVSPR